jgi:hypothetical protein
VSKEFSEIEELPFSAVDLNNPVDLDPKKVEFLKKEKEAALGDAMIKVASFDGRVQDPYPSPFLNLADTQIPRTTTEIFRWCKYFYTFDPLIAGAVNALASFPITEVYLEDKHTNAESGDDSDAVKLYKRVFFKELNIYKLLIEIGIDYYLYGNCFVFGELWTNPASGGIEWKNMVRLDPSKIIIDYNPATKEKKYKWQIPATLVNIVKKKRPKEEYDKIPDIIKEAVIKSSAIVLNSNNIYHFSRPTDSMGENIIWGTPVPANVLKLLMYRNVLRQAQEAIAREHIVPMRVYYIEKTQDYNPQADWNAVANAFANELNKATRDPNHKVVSPVPVNMINIGGQGRALLVTPEIEQIQSEILAGMNVPREFIFGGVSYSGSSISLKILENQFITYRLLQKDFMQNFIIKNMARARKEWVSDKDDDSLVTVKMSDLKMQDDVQQKQLIIQLNEQGKVTNDYMWKVIGVDADKMKAALEAEALEAVELDTKVKLKQLDAQLILQKKQIEIQAELQKHQAKFAPVGPDGNPVDPQSGAPIDPGTGAPMMAQSPLVNGQTPAPNSPAGANGGGIGKHNANPKAAQKTDGGGKGQQNTDGKEESQIKGIAMQLSKVGDKEKAEFLKTLPKNYRDKIEAALSELGKAKNSSGKSKIDMRPMPEQKPPRRNSLK